MELRPLELGDSSGVRVGDPTLAIGNPFGLERTLTTGVVSALGQRITAPSGFGIAGVIQTDATASPRNAGGPLLDARGRVIGINSQIDSDGEPVGFAVPIDTAKEVVPLLERDGRVRRAYLGIAGGIAADGLTVEQVQPELARRAGRRARRASRSPGSTAGWCARWTTSPRSSPAASPATRSSSRSARVRRSGRSR